MVSSELLMIEFLQRVRIARNADRCTI